MFSIGTIRLVAAVLVLGAMASLDADSAPQSATSSADRLRITRLSVSASGAPVEWLTPGAAPAIEVWTGGSATPVRSASARITSQTTRYDSGWRPLARTS